MIVESYPICEADVALYQQEGWTVEPLPNPVDNLTHQAWRTSPKIRDRECVRYETVCGVVEVDGRPALAFGNESGPDMAIFSGPEQAESVARELLLMAAKCQELQGEG